MTNLVNHINHFKSYALRLTGDINDAKDLLQDLALKVFSNVSYWEGKSDEDIKSMFAYKLKRLHIDFWRRKQYEPVIKYKDVENDVWHLIEKKELQKELILLQQGTDTFCFRLRLDGYSTNDISELTLLKTNNVNQSIMRIKKKLRQKFAA